jgi:hypothetical protein
MSDSVGGLPFIFCRSADESLQVFVVRIQH